MSHKIIKLSSSVLAVTAAGFSTHALSAGFSLFEQGASGQGVAYAGAAAVVGGRIRDTDIPVVVEAIAQHGLAAPAVLGALLHDGRDHRFGGRAATSRSGDRSSDDLASFR